MSSLPDKDQRTLAPSQKRIDDFRKRGEIALSRDLVHVSVTAAGVIALFASLPAIATSCRHLFVAMLGEPGAPVGANLGAARDALVDGTAPVMIASLVAFVATAGLQLGWPPAFKKLGFDLSKLASLGAIAELASPKAIARRMAISTARLIGALGVAGLAVWPEIQRLIAAPRLAGAATLSALAGASARIVAIAGAVLVGLAVLDYLHQRRTIGARMKMTLEEAKRESREQDGDPQIKRRRRQRMRELARRRLAAVVPQADVVIVNPTEYAVALRYDDAQDRAPRVVAKGRNEVAQRIRDLARGAGVPIVAQPPLARLIHKLVPEGREIPSKLYHAVAEVLAYVYRIRRGGRR